MTQLPIAKIDLRTGVSFSRAFGAGSPHGAVSYEWFYVELFEGAHHIVAIFSLADPFLPEHAPACASLYLTWHEAGCVVDYSYCLFENEAAVAFRTCVADFFERKSPCLEVAGRSHGGDHDLSLWLRWNTPGEPAGGHEIAQLREDVARKADAGTKHFWQPLAHGPSFSGRLFQSHTSEHDVPRRKMTFHDVPLARRLRGGAPRELSFSSAWCYVDHNAGFEPVSCLREPWFWWHARTLEASEIGYWFPTRREGYRVDTRFEPQFNELAPSDSPWRTVGFSGADPVVRSGRSLFGVPLARTISLAGGTQLNFSRVIEGAPFYARVKSVQAETCATLEALHPERLNLPLCRTLMGARQHRASTLPRPYGSHDFHSTCARVTSKHGRSFYLASHVLAARERQGAFFVYMLCRLVDDATDESGGEGSTGSALLMDALFEGAPAESILAAASTFIEASLLRCGVWTATQPIRARFFLEEARHATRHLALDRAHFEELVEGQRMDETFTQPRTFAECYLYCFRVAGVVGLLMARILRARETEAAHLAAEHLGIAMQLTNILRDVREDALTRGRVYLPIDLCERFGLTGPDLLTEAARDPQGAAELVRHVGAMAIAYYRSALSGVAAIPGWRSRLCVKLMTAIYGSILGVLLRIPSRSFESRVVIPVPRRLTAFVRVVLGADPLHVAGLAEVSQPLRPEPSRL